MEYTEYRYGQYLSIWYDLTLAPAALTSRPPPVDDFPSFGRVSKIGDLSLSGFRDMSLSSEFPCFYIVRGLFMEVSMTPYKDTPPLSNGTTPNTPPEFNHPARQQL